MTGSPARPGDRTLRVGIVLTVVGLVFTLVAMVPLVVPSVRLPGAFWFLAMLTGVGLLVVLAGLLRAARARGRAVTAAVETVAAPEIPQR
ncbi:MAG: hypothetical protein R2737_06690 [Candidatus Nanopelagicales bacterium]